MSNRLTIKECSKLLKISEQTLRILIQKGAFGEAAVAYKLNNSSKYYYIIYKNKMNDYINLV